MQNQIHKLIMITLFLPLLSGCGVFTPNEGDFITDSNWNIDQVILSCGNTKNDADCNGSVGVLFHRKRNFTGDYFTSRCTAWLVASDVIATNMHCVDDEHNGMTNVSVKETFFKLVETVAGHEKSIKATRLIKGYKNKEKGLDYAFLKLEKSINKVPVIKINPTPLINHTAVRAVSVNDKLQMKKNPTHFQLDSYDNCEVSMKLAQALSINYNEKITKFSSSRQGSIIGLENCPIVGGNSGSALIDTAGSARGIIAWGYTDKEKNTNEDKIGGASSFTCIPYNLDSNELYKQDATCDIVPSERYWL
ncbi:MAG: trypsin-like peptidase domain-containing protein [Bdellovibrionaceae bacterium]|jgi:hypothetical protein|nr:trypsin-like peptidase domain-containing protein [Pseudobdellovibrionaceae bacterium]